MEQEIVAVSTSIDRPECSRLDSAMQDYIDEIMFNMYMTYILKPQDFEDVWIHNCDYDNLEHCEGYHHYEHYDDHSEDDEDFDEEDDEEYTEDDEDYESYEDSNDDWEDEDEEEDCRTWVCPPNYIGDFSECI